MLWIEIDNSNVGSHQLSFGHSPALLMIDFVQAYTRYESPLFANGLHRAAREAADLLFFARQRKLPIYHSKINYAAADGGARLWLEKMPSMEIMQAGNPLAEFCGALAPGEGESVVTRNSSSAFFGTELHRSLHEQGVDTVVLAGGLTSDAIRSTAVDGIQHGFRVIVVRECVGDKYDHINELHLREIARRYGDVVQKKRVFEALRCGTDRDLVAGIECYGCATLDG